MKAVRVSLRMTSPPTYAIVVMETNRGMLGVELTQDQAADVFAQLGQILPPQLRNVDIGFSDEIPPAELGVPQ